MKSHRGRPFGRSETARGPDSAARADALARRNAELEAEVARLGEAVAARDALLAMAGHELRNPMTPILGRVQLLRHLVARPAPDLTKVGKALGEVEWLIGQYIKRATALLEVARLNGGRLDLGRAPVDVVALAGQVVRNFQPIADQSGAELRLSATAGTPMALADALAVEQVIDNLVSNAIKYGEGGPVAIEIDADPAAGRVIVCVGDRGGGIDAADLARIFERFERAVSGRDHRVGFGVGLWIARRLAEAMDGTLSATSRPGAGSTFRLSLPAWAPEITP